MNFEINMINVEDGDAILLQLRKENKKALIVIDGGYSQHYTKLKKRVYELLPDFENKIDLIVCTHYDNDHLEGISLLLDDCKKDEIEIGEIWLHKIDDSLEETIKGMEEKLKLEIEVSIPERKRLWELNHALTGFKKIDEYNSTFDNLVIENYNFLKTLLKKILTYGLEDKVKQVTRGFALSGFEEFKVISPTTKYYNDFLPKLRDEKFLNEISNSIREKFLVEEEKTIEEQILDTTSPCERLMKRSTGVTPTNMVSIVTLLKVNDLKLLFTGDSGIESYQKQSLLDTDLKDLDWLQLPHHGSKYNTSSIMLEHFNPRIVFVSGEGIENRPSSNIIKCLETKRRFEEYHVTNKEVNTWYLKIQNDLKPERILL